MSFPTSATRGTFSSLFKNIGKKTLFPSPAQTCTFSSRNAPLLFPKTPPAATTTTTSAISSNPNPARSSETKNTLTQACQGDSTATIAESISQKAGGVGKGDAHVTKPDAGVGTGKEAGSGSSIIGDASMKRAMGEKESILSSAGAVGRQFNPDGKIGQIGEKIGGPFSKDGVIGSQFDASKGGIAGTVEEIVGGPEKKKGKKD